MSLRQSLSFIAVFLLAFFTCAPGFAQQSSNSSQQAPPKANPPATQPKVKGSESVSVTANYTPEEKEDWAINEVYQPIFETEDKHDCVDLQREYESQVIPLAEKSQFEKPRDKFLFLAYRGIAYCYLHEKRYAAAEEVFKKLFDYVAVWPGKDTSDFALIYQAIGVSRLGQQDWKGAEGQLQQAVAVMDQITDHVAKTDPKLYDEPVHSEYSSILAPTLNYLAVAEFRNGRPSDALVVLERAYKVATDADFSSNRIKGIINSGLAISLASADTAAMDRWTARSKTLK